MLAETSSRAMTLAAIGVMVSLFAGQAVAGPPYLTDDPQPTDFGHWEIYNFVQGAMGPDSLSGEGGVDLNYGAAQNLQLTAVLPVAFDNSQAVSAKGLVGGPGVIELAAKYKFLHQAEGASTPDVSLFPRFFIPTDSRFGTGHVSLLLPVWAQKDFGPWSVFGGGGYQINPGAGERDFWQGGLTVTRDVTKQLNLGVEVFDQGSDSVHLDGFRTVNFGLTYKLVEHWSLLASAGPTWIDGGGHGSVFYLSLKADY
jgi:hypothetical protein